MSTFLLLYQNKEKGGEIYGRIKAWKNDFKRIS